MLPYIHANIETMCKKRMLHPFVQRKNNVYPSDMVPNLENTVETCETRVKLVKLM